MQDPTSVETKVIRRFETYLDVSKILVSLIYRFDKTLAGMGELYLYESGYRDKEHLVRKIPVRIKVGRHNATIVNLK